MTPASNDLLYSYLLPSAGTYLVRLSKAGQLADVSGNWGRCGFVAAMP